MGRGESFSPGRRGCSGAGSASWASSSAVPGGVVSASGSTLVHVVSSAPGGESVRRCGLVLRRAGAPPRGGGYDRAEAVHESAARPAAALPRARAPLPGVRGGPPGGPRRRGLSESVAKATIAPERARRIVDIPRFLSPSAPARGAFAADSDTPPPRTTPTGPRAPHAPQYSRSSSRRGAAPPPRRPNRGGERRTAHDEEDTPRTRPTNTGRPTRQPGPRPRKTTQNHTRINVDEGDDLVAGGHEQRAAGSGDLEGCSAGSWWRSPVRTTCVPLDHGGPTVVLGG